jgi:hypothetical protein
LQAGSDASNRFVLNLEDSARLMIDMKERKTDTVLTVPVDMRGGDGGGVALVQPRFKLLRHHGMFLLRT